MRPATSRSGDARRALASWAIALAAPAALAAPVAAAQQRNESLVSDQYDLIDSEFSQSLAMITWCDDSGALWVADIDRDTGQFVPADGKGTLVDPAAMTLQDLKIIGNGPEWIDTSDGDQIVYTKFMPGEEHNLATARMALAQRTEDGTWSHRMLAPSLRRNAPYSSHDPGDPLPRISYIDPSGNHYWRDLREPSSEAMIPLMPKSRRSVRFVSGARDVVYAMAVDGVSQVFLYSLDEGTTTQLTFDDGDKDLYSVPWSWNAPEFDNDRVLATVVDGNELRIYRESDGANGEPPGWNLVYRVYTPLHGGITSPEPFVYNGKSYVVFSGSKPPSTEPTAIFLATIDPAAPMLVQITPDLPWRIRRDPEIFVTSSGPYIYYNRLETSGSSFCIPCNEGVFRSYTGLPPPAPE